ncbi:xanthine dehydrogenase molybdopterin binding subunit [Cognatazoarcus halotolerans]|uniref:xanthine dehydrogenase molybdopterin binding subunit n=1 Tax=Cognatazoarcus halotolerans TaxID=2686016 RepID=UPI001359B647|nr:xanthine dehydrogenase molybdopterin binding subunit [Cognatazoarcus halotolerans]MCP5308355.1 xanthine dehydrogenase molybdopterin binding subunit [Zoogloeaceae bacterium]
MNNADPIVRPGASAAHESAHLHVAGEATYVDDIPELAGTLHAALGLSAKPHARIRSIDFAAVTAMPGVVAVLTAADIPGSNDCGPIIHDDPILADGEVHYVGQPMFAVVATSVDVARRAARRAVVDYEVLPAELDPRAARAAESFVLPPMRRVCGEPAQKLAAAPHRLQGQWSVGGQEQFYLEGQVSYCAPREDGCLQLWCSTQHPTEMQHVVAHCLNKASNQVVVEMRRMGGGFGGKESQSALFACVASLAASKLKRPVKLRLDRDDDMMITGKRHDFYYDYDVGFDDEGRILAVRVEMIARAGFSADLSGPVATRALCHFDNAYFLSDADISALCARTNTQSNTAFRGFGGPQGAIAIEYILDSIARRLGLDALDVRKANFYGKSDRNLTPYGQTVADNVIHELVADLEQSSDYRARREEILRWNADSPIIKKGLALTPVKFGISFNVVHFNQAGALVHIYTDGSMLVNHGGAEMGQGLNTKVAQVVAMTLGVPLSRVRATAADTSKVANTSATAASTGADLNGKAAEDAALQIRARLAALAAARFGGTAEAVRFADEQVSGEGWQIAFDELVKLAYEARVQLWSDGFYATPGLHWNRETLTGSPFFYFAYGAAVSEVAVDTLTGEWKLLRADLLHDAGNSINPAIDIGQVEGAYIQGMGWLTTEELVWNDVGRLTTHAPSTYKIPAVADCPAVFNTRLFHNPNHVDTIMRSKAVGEPPLLLPFSVFFAIRDAIAAVAEGNVAPPLLAPATGEAILNAVEAVRAARAQP